MFYCPLACWGAIRFLGSLLEHGARGRGCRLVSATFERSKREASTMLFRARFLGLVVPLMAAVGCMQERGTINRVQPDYLDKNDLVPNQYRALTKLNSTPETLTPQLLAREPVFATQNTL